MPRPMTFLAAHAPDGLLAPGGLLGTSHRFLFKIGGRNTTTNQGEISPSHNQAFNPAGDSTWSLGMGYNILTVQVRNGCGLTGALSYNIPSCRCAEWVDGAQRVTKKLS